MTTAKNNVFYLVEGGGIEFWWGGSKPPPPPPLGKTMNCVVQSCLVYIFLIIWP